MNKQNLVETLDEGMFLTILASSHLPDDEIIQIIKDRKEWLMERFRQGKPIHSGVITVNGKKVQPGERWTCPLTGRQRVNMGR